MAPSQKPSSQRTSKGKGKDWSTPWSKAVWDDRGYWFYERQNSSGEPEYDYQYPEATQTSQQKEAIPRSPGPNVISSADPSFTPSSEARGHAAQPVATSYTGGRLNPPSENNQNYHHFPTTAYASTGLYYSTAPVANTQYYGAPLVTNPSSSFIANSNVASTAGLALGMRSMSIISEDNGDQSHKFKNIHKAPGSNNFEELDSRYQVVDNQKRFWKVGRVFMMLWTEPARQDPVPREGGTRNGSHFSTTMFGEFAYSEIRRFVVMGVGHGNNFCSPIQTYSGQATLKPNLPEQQQHAIIYTSSQVPIEKSYHAEDESVVRENLTKDPIQVIREQMEPEGKLDPASRLNYSKIYTVENYVRVLNIGMVHQDSMASLLSNSFVRRTEPVQKPHKNPPRDKGKGKKRH